MFALDDSIERWRRFKICQVIIFNTTGEGGDINSSGGMGNERREKYQGH
jgi:hypothetical protein